MKIADLTQDELNSLADENPDFLAKHRPLWMLENRSGYMVKNHREIVEHYNPELLQDTQVPV